MAQTPTLYDWIGGIDALRGLTEEFYVRVKADPEIGQIFAEMDPGHPATWRPFWGRSLAVRRCTPTSTAAMPP